LRRQKTKVWVDVEVKTQVNARIELISMHVDAVKRAVAQSCFP
jgi:hypothetical protein